MGLLQYLSSGKKRRNREKRPPSTRLLQRNLRIPATEGIRAGVSVYRTKFNMSHPPQESPLFFFLVILLRLKET
jgi:hypothetical protein